MAEPALTPDQIAGLNDAIGLADAGSTGAQKQIEKLTASIKSQQDLESGMKSLFSYNNDVISNYELERRNMDGQTVQDPIVEADIVNFANTVQGNRLINGANLPPNRIPQFDGAPLIYADPGNTTDVNEVAQFGYQDFYMNFLILGFSSGPNAMVITTSEPINSGITTVKTNPLMSPVDFTPGARIGIADSSVGAVAKIVSSSSVSGMGGTVYTLQYSYEIPPIGVVGAGAGVYFSVPGFTNAERATKTSAGGFQGFMNTWVAGLTNSLNIRRRALLGGIAAFNANGNERKDTKALTEKNVSLAFIDGFLPTLDISDTGASALSIEESTRRTQISRRISDIAVEIKNGANGNFYNRRYDLAAARSTLGNGSLYVLIQLQNQLTKLQAGQSSAQGLSQRWSSFLPPS